MKKSFYLIWNSFLKTYKLTIKTMIWIDFMYQVYVYLIYICSFLYYMRQIKISCKILILVIPYFFNKNPKTPGFSPWLKFGLLSVIFTWSLT